MSLIINLAGHIRPFTNEIALALVATSLIIFGAAINTSVRNAVKSWNIVVRVIIFILLCSIGYGLLTNFLTDFLRSYLRGLSAEMFLLQVSLAFILVGVLAERGRWK